MMTDFKILSVDTERKTMVVDWGFVTLNHDIPLYILENPDLSKEQMLIHVSYMRPPVPVAYEVPAGLLELVEPPQEPTGEEPPTEVAA
ncbi:hypothetical protein ACVSNP_23470 [Pseudomonas aeruginosa]|uniref:hypothetical protein n=1 Tax=Pseudomonas aeruginosa TaxID=287 RepID=UPI0027383865|nr:hypothetical protein [Pseudomonas aeruginosa]